MSSGKNKNLLDEVRDVLRVKHYSIHTERKYCGWIKRFVKYHQTLSYTVKISLIKTNQQIEFFDHNCY